MKIHSHLSTRHSAKFYRSSLIIGNLLEHFDSSLYGFLAPLIGKTFFPNSSLLNQLMLTYGVYLFTFVARPLGGLYFSKLTYQYDPFHVLLGALFGVALSTGLMGIIPDPTQIGILAPCLLVIVRFFQSFCAAGESAIAGFYLIENTTKEKQTSWSSFYQSSTVIGILLASSLSTLIITNYEEDWRIAFLLGFCLGLWALGMRFFYGRRERDHFFFPAINDKILPCLKTHKYLILSLLPIYGFSYLTYSFTFILLNPYLALISPIPLSTFMEQTNSLLWLDALLFPAIAICVCRLSWEKTLSLSALLFAISASLLLVFLYKESCFIIYTFRLILVMGGVSFSAALIPWTASLFPPRDKYLLHSVSYNIGSELFGRSTPFICFWLYGITNHPTSPLIYVLGLTTLTLVLISGLHYAFLKQERNYAPT